jgi:septum formation protein
MTALVLASGSTARAQILRRAGVPFSIRPAEIDEEAVRIEMRGAGGRCVAERLAELKALEISTLNPQDLILGADQVLEMDGELFSKAKTLNAAAQQLRKLRGKKHLLICAQALAKGGSMIWRHTETATLWVRDFSDRFLETYLDGEGAALLGSVGCYRYEGPGALLFERVEGDYFSILGLSLLPLLAALRDRDVLPR